MKSWQKRYEQLKEQGLCVQCQEPAAPGLVRCSSCAAKCMLNREEHRHACLDKGICGSCLKRPICEGNSWVCAECRDLKKRCYEKRKEERVCYRCSEPAEDGRRACKKHLEAAREARRKKYRELAEKGICTTCSVRPAEKDKKVCKTCSEKARQRRKKKIEQKLCVDCNTPVTALTGRVRSRCNYCRRKRSRKDKQRNKKLKQLRHEVDSLRPILRGLEDMA